MINGAVESYDVLCLLIFDWPPLHSIICGFADNHKANTIYTDFIQRYVVIGKIIKLIQKNDFHSNLG